MIKLFGTDGVRGVAGVDITPKLAFLLGFFGCKTLGSVDRNPTFVIGMDTRISGNMLKGALVSGITACGGDIIDLGVAPTPEVAFAVKECKADGGIVISASHNTFEYNGIKFFDSLGLKLDDITQDEIETLVIENLENDNIREQFSLGTDIGKLAFEIEKFRELYSAFLVSNVKDGLDDLKIVLDCANGAGYKVAPKTFEKLGATIYVIGNEPDGININKEVGSTSTGKLAEKVLEVEADFGLAFDGDADRLMVLDEKGREVNGDKTIAILARMLFEKGELLGNRVTVTSMSNMGVLAYLKNKFNIEIDVTSVGDKNVLASMLKNNISLGGEQSGHIIFRNYLATGDGILSGIQFAKAVKYFGKKVSELSEEIPIFPQILTNVKVPKENKQKIMMDLEIIREIEKINKEFEEEGRIFVRSSGTEPIVRIMVEGKEKKHLIDCSKKIEDMITQKYCI